MTVLYEALKGFTDLPIAVLSLIFGLLTAKKNKNGAILFFLISFAAFLGTAVHVIDFSPFINKAIWVILYPLLFEAVRRASLFISSFVKGKKQSENKIIFAVELPLLAAAIIIMYLIDDYDMLVFGAFALICLLRCAGSFLGVKKIPRPAIFLVILLIFPIILQAFSKVIPYAVVFEHIVIAFLLYTVYKMAKTDL